MKSKNRSRARGTGSDDNATNDAPEGKSTKETQDDNATNVASTNMPVHYSSADQETTLSFYLPKDLAVQAWNMAAEEKLSFNAYVLKLLLEDTARLREEEPKVLKFPKRRRRRP